MPYLTLYGMNAEPNSIKRGVTLNLDVLCATLGPPATVIPAVPALKPGQTNRQRIDELTAGCGQSCHNDMINPLGFGFENFDGMGQWRDTENGGLAIDASGSYTFSDGVTRSWTGAGELMQVLASTPQTHNCYAKKLASYGLQRDIVAKDMPLITALTTSSMATTGSTKQMIVDLVRNNAFRTHARRHAVKRTPERHPPDHQPRDGAGWRGFGRRPARRSRPPSTGGRSCAGRAPSRSPCRSSRGCRSGRPGPQSSAPMFTFFLVGSCGVVGSKFFPSATGALTRRGCTA